MRGVSATTTAMEESMLQEQRDELLHSKLQVGYRFIAEVTTRHRTRERVGSATKSALTFEYGTRSGL